MSNKPSQPDHSANGDSTELEKLRARLARREAELYRLSHWCQHLERESRAIYQSFSWRIGYALTRLILWILHKPLTPTAEDHIRRIGESFRLWREAFFEARRREGEGLLPYMPWHSTPEYTAWWQRYYPPLSDWEPARRRSESWRYQPVFSLCLILPTDYREDWLAETLASIANQVYPRWELLVAHHKPLPESFSQIGVAHLKSVIRAPGMGRANTANRLLAEARGEFIIWVEAHDRLAELALYRLAERLNQRPEAGLLYVDEDKLDAKGIRYDPYFKPEWDKDLFCASYYVGVFVTYRRSRLIETGGFSGEFPGAEAYALWLRLLETDDAPAIEHLAEVLYHRRAATRHADQAFARSDSACLALGAHYKRMGRGEVEVGITRSGHLRSFYPLPDPPPRVSVLIPTRDRLALLRGTLEGLLRDTDYPALEILVLDNDSSEPETLAYLEQLPRQSSQVRVLCCPGEFNFSRLNNLGAARASGEVLLLLNNDMQVIHPDWLREMVSQVLRPEIGAVGAKLYYPDDTLQHAGVVTGLGGMAGHALKHVARDAPGYHWFPFVARQCTVVTAACLAVRKSVFEQVGGLEEKHLRVAFNDVDFCLRLGEHGYKLLWTPHAELYHLESASRGEDNHPVKYFRLQSELSFMRRRWGHLLAHDPCYNPNLTLQYEDYALAYPPRTQKD